MPTAGPRASKIFCNLIELNVPVYDLQQKLDWTLQPHMKAPLTSGLNHHAIVQIPKRDAKSAPTIASVLIRKGSIIDLFVRYVMGLLSAFPFQSLQVDEKSKSVLG